MFAQTLCSELGEKMALGGKVALLGILVVFVLLTLIVFILQIMDAVNKKLASKPKKERKKRKKSADNAEICDAEPSVNTPQITVSEDVDNNETVAAIVAALAVALQGETAENPDALFVVKKITKANFRR